MKRVSTYQPNYDMQYYLRRRNNEMSRVQNQIGSQSRITNLRDDPIAAAHSVRYKSAVDRLSQFDQNAAMVLDEGRIAESYLKSANDILHQVRELAVKGANDTLNKDDKRMIGGEIDQLLKELVEIANARGPDGTSFFAGDRTMSPAYRVIQGSLDGGRSYGVTNVEYIGTITPPKAEVSSGNYIQAGFSGNNLFWAEQQQLFSGRDASSYTLTEDSLVRIDNEYVKLSAGDNIHAIIAKINDSAAAVKASLDPVENSLVLSTTSPHQLWLEDVGDGRVLKDLGVIAEIGKAPYNLARGASLSGGSLFDMVMNLRDSLLKGDTIEIGGSALKGISMAQDNLIETMSGLGSRDERLQLIRQRIAQERPEIVNRDSQETDVDLAEAITDLTALEQSHKAALQTAGKILQPTLLDFLR
ncbi:flagellar hook-associated protein 3 [Sediminispirochaeta smaragdinae]|uniref:Flagellar hook-associated protein 3 n=1 Tax=Sediminispirochaeta smaragdinae (strain DSM 11293 / JCM 15392 / SEBR 4228) TaxID=573413 RepID=E1R4H8_SEDSS|nr:flagellar hook-associated protein 3 [Sediminispirochaeta smaragdinae]ADK81719.1 flagellar hook-associated protein 3 [Sediminispirochaeta smaragdinae DSM 11293]